MAFVSSQRPSGQFKGLVEEAEGREVSFLKIKVKEREFKRKRKVFNSNGILFNLKRHQQLVENIANLLLKFYVNFYAFS